MNQSYGILIFGFCFFVFLTWLWRYPDAELLPEKGNSKAGSHSRADSQVPMDTVYSEVDNWLSENGLESLQGYVRTAGM